MGIIGSSFGKLEGWLSTFTIEVFASILRKEWIDQALVTSGRETQRERKLTATLVVWLTIAMGFYRNLSIPNVLCRIGNVFGVGSLWEDGKAPTSGSIVEARTRVGFGPLRKLFEQLRQWILETHRESMSWKGWLLLDLDGTTLKVPDSDENRRRFGLPGSHRGRAAFPQMRALFLVSARLRFVLGAVFSPYGRGETTLALRMLRFIPPRALLILDRGFNSWQFLLGICQVGNEFLLRVRQGIMKGRILSILGPGDRLIEIKMPRALRSRLPSTPKTTLIREITVRIKGKPYRFFTSLLDAQGYPAVDLVFRYAERWQEEIALDEIKTHQCGATTVNRPVIIRSEASRRVLQEVYGLVLAYNLIRILMTQAAIKFDVPPLRVSFVDSMERIRSAALLMAAARTPLLPTIFDDLLHSIAQCILPKRKHRDNPRAVCIKMSKFPLKQKRRAS